MFQQVAIHWNHSAEHAIFFGSVGLCSHQAKADVHFFKIYHNCLCGNARIGGQGLRCRDAGLDFPSIPSHSHLNPILFPSYSHLIPIDRQRFALLQIDRGLIVSISRWPRYVARAQMSMQKLLICRWSAISIRSHSPRQYKNYTFIVPTFERLWPAIQLFLHIWAFSPKQGGQITSSTGYKK